MRYTAVFEFSGNSCPAVGARDGWLSGRLVSCTFEDETARVEALIDAVNKIGTMWRLRVDRSDSAWERTMSRYIDAAISAGSVPGVGE